MISQTKRTELQPRLKTSLGGFPKLLVIIALVIGVFLRFYNLDGKLYSNDETFSTTNIFGRDVAEIIDTQIVSVEELQSYQQFNPKKVF